MGTNTSNHNNMNRSQQNNNNNNSRNSAYANRNFNQLQKKATPSLPSSLQHQSPSIPAPITTVRRFIAPAPTSAPTPPPNPTQYQCPYCTYTTNLGAKADYLLHVKDHLCGKTFRCVLCNSVYKYRGDCVVHLKRKHQKADMIAHSYVDKFNLDQLEVRQIYIIYK